MNKSCTDSLLFYFDILGYKEKIYKNSLDFFNVVQNAIEKINNIVNNFSDNFNIKIFSDNAVVSIDNTEENLQKLISLAILIQASLMQNELLIRGSITSGEFYMDNICVYGNALVRAVELEHEAKYPRVIIDTKINTEIFIKKHLCIKDYSDEYVFINFLELKNIFQKIELGSIGQSNLNSPMELINVDITKIKEFISKASNENCNYKGVNKNNIAEINSIERKFYKYLWLIEYYNKFCSNNRYTKIKYELSLCKKLMKINLKIV